MTIATNTVGADFAAAFPTSPSQTENTPNNRENGEGGVAVATTAAATAPPPAEDIHTAAAPVEEITGNNVGAAFAAATPTPPS